jgi:hypothetical protein
MHSHETYRYDTALEHGHTVVRVSRQLMQCVGSGAMDILVLRVHIIHQGRDGSQAAKLMAVNTPITAVCNSLGQMLLQDVFILDIKA